MPKEKPKKTVKTVRFTTCAPTVYAPRSDGPDGLHKARRIRRN
jgi:hypothetical protein